jgi:hypothetical protein
MVKNYTQCWYENPKEGDYLEDLGVYGRIILKLTLKKQDDRMCTGLIWLNIGTSVKL